jgi:hypothetical protein
MRDVDQLVVEVHLFPISADELAEQSRNLRALLLRGARRSIQENGERKPELRNAEETGALPLDLVER